MIHFVADSPRIPVGKATPYAEAVERLTSLKRALELVDGVPAPSDQSVTSVQMIEQSGSKYSHFEAESGRAVAGVAAGIEALVLLQSEGRGANLAGQDALADEIRARLNELGVLFSL